MKAKISFTLKYLFSAYLIVQLIVFFATFICRIFFLLYTWVIVWEWKIQEKLNYYYYWVFFISYTYTLHARKSQYNPKFMNHGTSTVTHTKVHEFFI